MVRPSVSYTNTIKKEQLREYDYKDKNPLHYEEDHIVPLAIGGNPTDPKNLFPEPRYGSYTAANKDRLEVAVWHAVCLHHANLAKSQAIFLGDYRK